MKKKYNTKRKKNACSLGLLKKKITLILHTTEIFTDDKRERKPNDERVIHSGGSRGGVRGAAQSLDPPLIHVFILNFRPSALFVISDI